MFPVKVGIIGGSGLDNPDIFKSRSEKRVTTIFGDPSDILIEGTLGDVPCVLLARHGRKHNINPTNVNYRANIWALKEIGCTHVIVSAAVGSLLEDFRPGEFVILNNFIDRTTKRFSTFYDGQSKSPKGVTHIPMEPAFCERTRQIVIDAGQSLGLNVHDEGTIVVIEGPRFSTKAESLMYRQWGGHVVGMTTVPEVILAKEAGLCYSAIALITDYDCWKADFSAVNVEKVEETFKENVKKVTDLIIEVVTRIGKDNWDDTIKEKRDTVTKANMMRE
ncbi:S-methyl-5'-thioadenosine phosphorylase [Agrilus planipennis]|uniref:S-methyl-5'-thioadenosine phosphorylase n=1 Tax=Agrilus planipennis TaxID=224129 RepID=A0A1W4XN90_AGRPL|nr:S-methyl-5'-thioadenosine phosphorylase [Agrilus planipennis]XP_018334248.1 S-methyl-5'-thioadenosine phosphorylase [Agrilus planipennis]